MMNNSQTLEKMRQMRMPGMHGAFRTSLETGLKEALPQDRFVAMPVASERDDRRNRAVERAVKQAGFRYKASPEQPDYSPERGLDMNPVHRLSSLDFVKEHRDVLITGPAGTGKSFLASAPGYHACREGCRVLYANITKLMGQLKFAGAKGTLPVELKKIEKSGLLILDDFGLQPLDTQAGSLLMDIMEDRHQKHASMITSRIPVKNRHDAIGEKTVADALPDRIVHHALRVELYGESPRKKKIKNDAVSL